VVGHDTNTWNVTTSESDTLTGPLFSSQRCVSPRAFILN
jgi:hypothetical protein